MINYPINDRAAVNSNLNADACLFADSAFVCTVAPETSDVISDFAVPEQFEEFAKENFSSSTKTEFADHPTEWTSQLEAKFRRLAEDRAIGKLSFKAKVELEKLIALRRQLKYSRTGEEVLLEYQQRVLTRNLVNALAQYVTFHKESHRSR